VLLAALVAGTLSGGVAVANPAAATPHGPDAELGVEIDPCDDSLLGCVDPDPDPVGPTLCDEKAELCDLTAELPDPDDPTPTPEPEDVDSDVITVNPRFTG